MPGRLAGGESSSPLHSRGCPDAALGVWVPWHKRLIANRVAEIFPLVALRPGRSKPRPGLFDSPVHPIAGSPLRMGDRDNPNLIIQLGVVDDVRKTSSDQVPILCSLVSSESSGILSNLTCQPFDLVEEVASQLVRDGGIVLGRLICFVAGFGVKDDGFHECFARKAVKTSSTGIPTTVPFSISAIRRSSSTSQAASQSSSGSPSSDSIRKWANSARVLIGNRLSWSLS